MENSKNLGLRIRMGLSMAVIAVITWFGICQPLVRIPANGAKIDYKLAHDTALTTRMVSRGPIGSYDFVHVPDTRSLEEDVTGDWTQVIIGSLLIVAVGIVGFRRPKNYRTRGVAL